MEKKIHMKREHDFFQMCFFNNIKLLSHSPSENRIYLETEDGQLLQITVFILLKKSMVEMDIPYHNYISLKNLLFLI